MSESLGTLLTKLNYSKRFSRLLEVLLFDVLGDVAAFVAFHLTEVPI